MSTPPQSDDIRPSARDIETIAAAVYARLPERFKASIKDIVFRVEEFPDDEICAEFDLETPFDLLGLYQGLSLDRQSVSDMGGEVDMIFLYRRPIIDYWQDEGGDLERIVQHVLIHEIGHHFGFSDADMEAIEASD